MFLINVQGKNDVCYCNNLIVDSKNSVVYMNLVGVSSTVNSFLKTLKYSEKIFIRGDTYSSANIKISEYEIIKEKDDITDQFVVTLFKKEDKTKLSNNVELYNSYIIYRSMEECQKFIFKSITKNTCIPLLESWKDFIYRELRDNDNIEGNIIKGNFECQGVGSIKVTYSSNTIISIITNGLKEKKISVSGNVDNLSKVKTLDEYLNEYGVELSRKITNKFTPIYNHKRNNDTNLRFEKLSNFLYYNTDFTVDLFSAQKALILGGSKALNTKQNKSIVICGEMGTGKTKIGLSMTYATTKKDGYSCVVMCPTHLIYKWQREIFETIPNSEVYIVENLKDFINIQNKILDCKKSQKNIYVLMSYSKAKDTYTKMPSVIFSKTKNKFICPICGEELSTNNENKLITMENFTSESYINKTCDKCKAQLWQPYNKQCEQNWINITGVGWINKDMIDDIIQQLKSSPVKLTYKYSKLLVSLLDYKEDNESINIMAPRRYSIAKYIKKYFKNKIDFLIADEVHELKSKESLQGKAFGCLVNSCKYKICLTGTLVNGYADSIFYTLFRLNPNMFIKEGYDFYRVSSFINDFGVTKEVKKRYVNRGELKKNEKLPGISPLVFTNFLMENTMFLSLSDIDSGLPSYKEIPIVLDMPKKLKDNYIKIEEQLRNNVKSDKALMSQFIHLLSVYPDKFYDNKPIINKDTRKIIFDSDKFNLDKTDVSLYVKQNALLDLVLRKKAAGEKVLVYYSWSNKTNIAQELKKLFKENNIKVAHLTSSVSSKKREQWINDKVKKNDIDVMICNPNLVKTGLDLLDFSTIVFYQIEYNIFTLRQASRRSLRLNQTKDIEVYYIVYKDTVQEQALALMANKLQASLAIEGGKFSEEGLRALSSTEDLMTQVANNVFKGIKHELSLNAFSFNTINNNKTISNKKKNIIKPFNFKSYLYRNNDKTINFNKSINLLDKKLKELCF